MIDADLTNTVTETNLRLALSDLYPDSNYGAAAVIDQLDALEAYRAFDDGVLAELPVALAANVNR